MVFEGRSRVIDVGVRTRLFTGALRRAIEVRDRTCTWPGCDTPVDRCEIDHRRPFAQGGPTTQANGDAKCGFHHRLRQRSTRPFQVDTDPKGHPRHHRPDGTDIV
ncbi:hypothetical protein BH24ACT3_BH24ACT3_10170 [soil metagenome]